MTRAPETSPPAERRDPAPTRGGLRRPWFGSLRSQLTIVILLAGAPGLVILLLHGADARREARTGAMDHALSVARSAAVEESRRFSALLQTLDAVAKGPECRGSDPSAVEAFLRMQLEKDDAYEAIAIAGPDGAVHASAVRSGRPVFSFSGADWLHAALETRRVAVGGYERAAGGQTRISAARPILDASGEPVGVVAAVFDLSTFADSVMSDEPTGSSSLLLDATGAVLARRPAAPDLVGRLYSSEEARRETFAHEFGSLVAPGVDGVRELAGYTRFQFVGGPPAGRIVFETPEAAALAAANAALARGAGWMVAIGLLALLAARSLAERKVLAPLSDLSRAVEGLRSGDTAARVGHAYGSGEIGRLQRAFDAMAVSLERDRREFAAAERKYRTLVEELPAALYVLQVGPDREINDMVYMSPQIAGFGGFDPKELLGPGKWLEVVHPEDRLLLVSEIRHVIDSGEAFAVEHRIVGPDGAAWWVRNSGALIRDAGGRPTYVRGFMFDVSERKALEGQLQRSQKLEAIGQLAAGVAHDFNNLLTVILGYTQILDEMAEKNSELRGRLREIQKAGDRAATLTHRLLAFTRKSDVAPVVLDLRNAVAEIDQMVARLLGARIEVRIVAHPGGGLVLADPGHVDQILMNLVVNARDAMPDGGKLTIEVYDRGPRRSRAGVLPGPHVCVSVSDTGCGMDAETQNRIFEPFFTTKPAGKGTGLGLATAYALVKQNGGFIAFDSEVGKGTTFRVYLPQLTDAAGVAPQATAAEHDEARGSGTVLVVDDEEGVRALACAALSDRGYHVIEAARGDDAIRIAETHDGPIVALVTDIALADMDGREVAARVATRRPETKILLMSGYAEKVVREGMRVPDAAFLAKPFTPRDLAVKLRDLVVGRPEPPSAPDSDDADE